MATPRGEAVSFSGRGIAISLVSSVLFASMYYATPRLSPLPAEAVWAIRNLITIPFVLLVILVLRQGPYASELLSRMRRRPALIPVVVICGFIVSTQLWLFGWAPLHGRGMQVALGYFLLPLVLVVIGRFAYRDRMTWWQWLACGIAAVGVAFEVVRVGGISWETLVVALGYPVYFVLRRAIASEHLGSMLWEFVSMSPFAAFFLLAELSGGSAFQQNPSLGWFAPVFAVWSAAALLFYLIASRLLPMSLFGLLGYVEPSLLVVASLLNGERIAAPEMPIYLAVWTAVLVLVVGGTLALLRARRSGRGDAGAGSGSSPGREGPDPADPARPG